MNQRDSLHQAHATVYAAKNVTTTLHNLLVHAISCTPSGSTRNALATANIQLGHIEAILQTAGDGIIDLLRKETEK